MFLNRFSYGVYTTYCIQCRFDERQKRLGKLREFNRPNDCSICFVIVVGGSDDDDENSMCMKCSESLYRGGDTQCNITLNV